MYRIAALFVLICALAASVSAADEEKVAAPSAQDVDKATKLVRELFKDDYAKTAAKARQSLAEKLFKQAEETNDDPAARYALYHEAAEVAASAGDVHLTLEALGAVRSRFSGVKADAAEPPLKALAVKSVAADALTLANYLLKTVDDAVALDDLDTAERLAKLAETAANRSKNIRTSSLATARIKEVDAFKKEAPAVKKALEAVDKATADAAAATIAGKYYCFQRGEWEKGIPLLTGSDDAKLKAVAEKEAGGLKEAGELLAVADAWYDYAATAPAHLKRPAQGRAFGFYTKAAPDLTGINRTRADKRLEELEKVVAGGAADEFWGAVRIAVRNKDVEEIKPGGGAFGDKEYREAAPGGGVLIGFNYTLGKFFNNDVVGALQPIYLTPTGEKLGAVYGKVPAKWQVVKAKPGYAVAQITFRAGGGLDGYQLTFMRIQGKGLNPADKYDSPFMGGKGGGMQRPLGDSRPIVGIYGKRNERDEEWITNMGLVLAGGKPLAPPKK